MLAGGYSFGSSANSSSNKLPHPGFPEKTLSFTVLVYKFLDIQRFICSSSSTVLSPSLDIPYYCFLLMVFDFNSLLT